MINNYEHFVAFLKENNCYDRYIKNIICDRVNLGFTLEQFFMIIPTENWILFAFIWADDSPVFWAEIHKKWIEELKNP